MQEMAQSLESAAQRTGQISATDLNIEKQ